MRDGTDQDEILAAIDAAFGDEPRPPHFVRDPQHCEECADHEATLQRLSRRSISLSAVGNPGWDPLCYVTDEGFRHLMPGLARLACGRSDDYFLDQFLFHLESGRIDALTAEQAGSLGDLLDHLARSNADEIVANMDEATLARVREGLDEKRKG